MKEIIKKFKNEELLNYYDLENYAKYLINTLNLDVKKITFSKMPGYDFAFKYILLNCDYNSKWIKDELTNFDSGKAIKQYLNKEKIETYKGINFYNFVLLNSVTHEIRHAYQRKLIEEKNLYEKEDITLLKNLLKSLTQRKGLMDKQYHDSLYYEYDADLRSALFLNDINNEYLESDEISNFNELASYKILRAYISLDKLNKSYPIKNNNDLFKEKMEIIDSPIYNYLKSKNDTKEDILNGGINTDSLEHLSNIYLGHENVKNLKKIII